MAHGQRAARLGNGEQPCLTRGATPGQRAINTGWNAFASRKGKHQQLSFKVATHRKDRRIAKRALAHWN